MSSCEVYDSYINTIDVIEDSVIDDNSKFPIVRDNKLKADIQGNAGVPEDNNKLS